MAKRKYSRATKIEAAKSTRIMRKMWEHANFPKKYPASRARRFHKKSLLNWSWMRDK